MKFDLRKPCADCPFRKDVKPYLRPERAQEIAEAITKHDLTFACHKTTGVERGRRVKASEHQHCAGALILHEREGRPNWRIRFAAGLKLFDPALLDPAAPVYKSARDMIRAHRVGRFS